MPKWKQLGTSQSVSVGKRDITEPGRDQVSVNLGKSPRRKTGRKKQKHRKTETKTKTQTMTAFSIRKSLYVDLKESNSGMISHSTFIRLTKLVK